MGATEQHTVRALGRSQCQLIKGQNLTTGLQDACAGSGRHLKGSDAQLGHFQHTCVVGNSPDDDGGLALLPLHVSNEPGDRDRGTVGLGHKQTLEDHRIKRGVGTTGQEAVELD